MERVSTVQVEEEVGEAGISLIYIWSWFLLVGGGGGEEGDEGVGCVVGRPLRVMFFYFELSSSRVVGKSPSTESSTYRVAIAP